MKCPECGKDTRVLRTDPHFSNPIQVERVRECTKCRTIFRTAEAVTDVYRLKQEEMEEAHYESSTESKIRGT